MHADVLPGTSIAVSNDRILIGASGEDQNRGAAYMYDKSGNFIQKMTGADRAIKDKFGASARASAPPRTLTARDSSPPHRKRVCCHPTLLAITPSSRIHT